MRRLAAVSLALAVAVIAGCQSNAPQQPQKSAVVPRQTEVRIIAFGDSLVHGLHDASGVSIYNQTWPYLLMARLGETTPTPVYGNVFSTSYGDRTIFGNDWAIVPETFVGARFTMINSGVNGDDTKQMQARFQTDVLDRTPDYVIIMGGTNDLGRHLGQGEWGADNAAGRLLAMADAAKAVGAVPILVKIPAWNAESIPWVRRLNAVLAAGAAKRGFHVADVYSAMCTPAGTKKPGMSIADGIHLSQLGNSTSAEAFDPAWFGYRAPVQLGI